MPPVFDTIGQSIREPNLTSNTKDLFSDALALPPVERASLIEQLLASFDQELRSAADLRWAAECEARLDAYDAG